MPSDSFKGKIILLSSQHCWVQAKYVFIVHYCPLVERKKTPNVQHKRKIPNKNWLHKTQFRSLPLSCASANKQCLWSWVLFSTNKGVTVWFCFNSFALRALLKVIVFKQSTLAAEYSIRLCSLSQGSNALMVRSTHISLQQIQLGRDLMGNKNGTPRYYFRLPLVTD